MEQNIKQFIWDFFTLISELFPPNIAKKLQEFKDEEKQDIFYDSLELIFDMDSKLLETIEQKYLEKFDNSEDKITELANLLEVSPYDNFTTKIKYISTAISIIDTIPSEKSATASLLYNNLAKLYNSMGKYQKAKPLYEKALKIREEIVGKNHPDTATSYNDLAGLYGLMGEYETAKQFHEKALNIREELLGENHPDTATSYNDLAGLYELMGEYETAKRFHEKALKIREEIFGENHPDTASSYNNLAILYDSMGKYQEAKSLYEKALKIREEIFGENHPDTASSYNNLAGLYALMGKYKEAESLYEKALKIREEIFGENHPDTASSYNGLALIYYYINENKKATPLYEKALKIREEIFGENHPDTASSYNNLAILYDSMGKYQEAESLYEKALKIREEIVGENHPDTASSYNNLATLYDAMGAYQKAKPLYEKALKIQKEIFGENHPDTAMTYNNLAILYNSIEKYKEAKSLYEKALSAMIQSDCFNHKNTDAYYNNYKLIKNTINFTSTKIGINPYIQKATIKDFKLLADFKITFNEKINIIIGENSSGKTSLLQALTLGLLEEKYIGENNEKYHQYITKTKESSKITLEIDKYTKEVEISPKERKITNNILSPFVLAYGSNIFTRYKDEVNDLVQDILHTKINTNFTTSIFKDYTDSFFNPKSILNELNRIASDEKNELSDKSKELEEIFVKIINDFVDDFELIKSDNGYLFKHNGKTDFKLENLSEGYRNNILLISDILIRIFGIGERPDTIEGIILIDEFDRHLHPKWQSNVVSKLSKNFPKIQFILTTHNPMSTLDREADEITIIKELEGKLEAVKGKGTKNIDVGTVLLKYFGVDSLVGKTMQKNIKRFTELKLKDNLSNEELKEIEILKEDLDETVATNFIYNNGYFKFLKFVKSNKDINFDDIDDLTDEELDGLLSDFKDSL